VLERAEEQRHPSIAQLLDSVRPLIAEAKDAGAPRYLLLPPAEYDEIERFRKRDRELGVPLMLLGLEIVRADDPTATPRVF
jgi:hypothetical protein